MCGQFKKNEPRERERANESKCTPSLYPLLSLSLYSLPSLPQFYFFGFYGNQKDEYAINAEHGQPSEYHISILNIQRALGLQKVRYEVRMRQHHTFRQATGARGVRDHHDVVLKKKLGGGGGGGGVVSSLSLSLSLCYYL